MNESILMNLQIWRQKAADGTITLEEMKEAINAIRKTRLEAEPAPKKERATTTATPKKSKSAVAKADADTMLAELGLDL